MKTRSAPGRSAAIRGQRKSATDCRVLESSLQGSRPVNGEELTRWTIRLALAAYAGRLALDMADPRGRPARESAARWLWTIACALLWIHVACAFQFQHDWSHAAAYRHTAARTAAVIGFDWGGGLWINYLLVGLWAGDVLWWWASPQTFRARPALVEWAWQGSLAFVVFNATVVFEEGPIRWVGLVASVVLLGMWRSQSLRVTKSQSLKIAK